jgi:hypothetical protein
MKLTTAAALLALSPLVEAAKDRRPPVSSKKLQKLITEKGYVMEYHTNILILTLTA